MKIIINKPRRAVIGNGMTVLHDLNFTKEQMQKLIEDLLMKESIIAQEVRAL